MYKAIVFSNQQLFYITTSYLNISLQNSTIYKIVFYYTNIYTICWTQPKGNKNTNLLVSPKL